MKRLFSAIFFMPAVLFLFACSGGIIGGSDDSDDSAYIETCPISCYDDQGNKLGIIGGEWPCGTLSFIETPSVFQSALDDIKPGYRFLYWTVDGEPVQKGYVLNNTNGTDFIGVWEIFRPRATFYDVYYYGDGYGDKPNYVKTVEVDIGTTIPLDTPASDDYSFLGWHVTTMPRGIVSDTGMSPTPIYSGEYSYYIDEYLITENKDIYIFAGWFPSYTYTYYFYDDDRYTLLREDKYQSGYQTILIPVHEKECRTRLSWEREWSGSPLLPNETHSEYVHKDQYFYAAWEEVEPIVTFYEEDGEILNLQESGAVTPCGAPITLPVLDAKPGYTFNGWLFNNVGPAIPAGTSYSVTKDTSFHAKWTPDGA